MCPTLWGRAVSDLSAQGVNGLLALNGSAIDCRAYLIGEHQLGSTWAKHCAQFLGVVVGRIKPCVKQVRLQNHWHSIMDRRHYLIRFGCNDAGRNNRFAARRLPCCEQARKGKVTIRLCRANVIGLLPDLAALFDGIKQRCLAKLERKAGFSATVSPRALFSLLPMVGSLAHEGINPHLTN